MRRILTGILALSLLLAPALVFAQASPYPLIANATLQASASTAANGTNFDTSRLATVVIQAVHTSGTTTVTLEASNDGTNWTAMLACTPIGTASNASTISVTTTPKLSRCVTTGVPLMRVRISTCTSCVGVIVTASGSSVPLGFND